MAIVVRGGAIGIIKMLKVVILLAGGPESHNVRVWIRGGC